jgi:antitoxin ParD1/3/4
MRERKPAMRTMTISLSPQQAGRIEAVLETDEFASKSEVGLDALRMRAAIDEGHASGPGRSVTAAELTAEFKARAAARG